MRSLKRSVYDVYTIGRGCFIHPSGYRVPKKSKVDFEYTADVNSGKSHAGHVYITVPDTVKCFD